MVASSGMRFSAQTSRTNTSLHRGRGGRSAEGGTAVPPVVAGDGARRLDMVGGGSVESPAAGAAAVFRWIREVGGGFHRNCDADAKQEPSPARTQDSANIGVSVFLP